MISLLGSGIAAEEDYRLAHLAQVVERIGHVALLRVAADVGVELVFPRPPFDGARLELGQVDVAQGEDGQRAEERAGRVRSAEDDGRLARSRPRRTR